MDARVIMGWCARRCAGISASGRGPVSERVPVTNFSASWVRVDQTSDPLFYACLLDATRADGLAEARRDPDTAFAPLKLRPGGRVQSSV